MLLEKPDKKLPRNPAILRPGNPIPLEPPGVEPFAHGTRRYFADPGDLPCCEDLHCGFSENSLAGSLYSEQPGITSFTDPVSEIPRTQCRIPPCSAPVSPSPGVPYPSGTPGYQQSQEIQRFPFRTFRWNRPDHRQTVSEPNLPPSGKSISTFAWLLKSAIWTFCMSPNFGAGRISPPAPASRSCHALHPTHRSGTTHFFGSLASALDPKNNGIPRNFSCHPEMMTIRHMPSPHHWKNHPGHRKRINAETGQACIRKEPVETKKASRFLPISSTENATRAICAKCKE